MPRKLNLPSLRKRDQSRKTHHDQRPPLQGPSPRKIENWEARRLQVPYLRNGFIHWQENGAYVHD